MYLVDLLKVELLYNNSNVSYEWINIARSGGGIYFFVSCLDKWFFDLENVDFFIFEFLVMFEFMDEGFVVEVYFARLTYEFEIIMY